jgi:hypothetical protein
MVLLISNSHATTKQKSSVQNDRIMAGSSMNKHDISVHGSIQRNLRSQHDLSLQQMSSGVSDAILGIRMSMTSSSPLEQTLEQVRPLSVHWSIQLDLGE